MPECIFCQEDGIDLPSDCEKCPECGSPPFSGMMFDPKRKEEAERLEGEGDLDGAWEILSEEWVNHTDMTTSTMRWQPKSEDGSMNSSSGIQT